MAITTKWPTTCGQCGKRVDKSSSWVVGHIKSRALHPELTWDQSNWRIEHRKCSDRSGQKTVIEKAKAEAVRAATGVARSTIGTTPPLPMSLADTTAADVTGRASSGSVDAGAAGVSSRDDVLQEPPPFGTSLSPGQTPIDANDALLWTNHDLTRYAWLRDLAAIPDDAAPPLYMTPVSGDAVCSYGWAGCTHLQGLQAAVPWIESTQQITLRWWQDLSIRRQLEHDVNGDLIYRKKIESAPRRAGKSVGLRGSALWRMATGPTLWGEPQNVIHTGSDLNICREVQRGSWNWAEAYGWHVTRGNGKEAVETDDARWLVRAQDGVYGYDCSLGLVDEGWDVKPDTVSEGLEPATLERVNPQMVLTSTAHRRATSLMRTELANALTMSDPAVLLLLWGALPDCDPGDPAVWRAASPFWSKDRERMIRAKFTAALAGQDDPEFDDPDPMRGFMAQYLNVWTIAEPRLVGKPVVESGDWHALQVMPPDRAPDSIAVESWFDQGVSVAQAWRTEDGRALVRVDDYPSVTEAAEAISWLDFRRPVLVGTSLLEHPAWKRHKLRTQSIGSATRTQVGALMRMLLEGTLRHAGTAALTDQVVALRVSPGVDGPRIRSTERADAIKAATWAAAEAQQKVRRKVVVPTRYQSVA